MFDVFWRYEQEGCWRPEESTLVSVLSACTHLGALDLGRCTHGSLLTNINGLNVIVETSLIDMYVKCGSLDKGLCLFHKMIKKNQLSYSVIISGLAMHGHGREALKVFSEMLKEGLAPDDVTYVGVLSACSHAGLINEGLRFFNRMQYEHGIAPTVQHYGCLVDLMGRAGKLDEAIKIINSMRIRPNEVIWRSLLSACRVHQNMKIGEIATINLCRLNSNNPGDYLLLSNMYARARKWDDVARIRITMVSRGLNQTLDLAWLRYTERSTNTSQVLIDVDDKEKRERLKYHSQKLAIAFALLHTSQGSPIRIARNLRMCSDCHTYAKFISVIFEREITVRDRYRFHHFKDGTCSCRDYW
ncbi:hypothetical protein FNV43_RR08406 [Rhamnella rubrinervis]|uniref:DYW domain-containing protein n=1 Tax=Rhamnella rubrinervis TaxID=2594499 RepID=A0A8K0H996_9ROSA|nr:hypothetical protein FNV43_RR08406 [Rhamnella rubrinervis]